MGDLGPGTQNVAVNMSVALVHQIDERAKTSGVTRSEWIRTVLEDAVRRRLNLERNLVQDSASTYRTAPSTDRGR